MSDTTGKLMEMYEAMRRRFGHRHWWPAVHAETPAGRKLEICIGAVLTQNTNWRNVERALENLRQARCLDVEAIHEESHEELAELIRPAGYYNVKTRRLKNFIAKVHDEFDGDVEAFLDRSVWSLREDLLSISGVGRETADSMILYAAGKPTFVVDAYTYRVLLRHFVIAPEDDYEIIKELMESSLPEDVELWNDYHAQLVEVGKRYCRTRARCSGCPLEQFEHDPQAGAY